MVVVPWLCVQLAAAPVVAGVYGIAEGWLAIPPGSDQWWPLTPAEPALSPPEDAAEILGPYEITGPPVVEPPRPLPDHGGERMPRW